MNICEECKHMRRGYAIARPAETGQPSPPPRPSFYGGDYICGARPIKPGKIDPQTGHQASPRGEDCRDINPDGNCQDFELGSPIGGDGHMPIAAIVGMVAFLTMAILIVLVAVL